LDQNFVWVFDQNFLEVQLKRFMSSNFGDVVHNMQNTKLDDFLELKNAKHKIGRVFGMRRVTFTDFSVGRCVDHHD